MCKFENNKINKLTMKKLSLIMLIAMLISACSNAPTTEQKTETVSPAAIQIAIIDVTGMHCDACVKTITASLDELEGVEDVIVSLEYEQAKVKFDPEKVGTEDFKAAIEDKGYGIGEIEMKVLEKPVDQPE